MANHSAYFPRVSCRKDERCKLGGLYYILSQIIPVTILFSLLLAFDISLTGGHVNGIILYTQMFDALLLTANDFLWFEPPVYKILVSLRVISRVMNLQFFAYRTFSFCLWKGARALDIFAFNYVIIGFSFLLVVFTVKVIHPLIYRIKRKCRRQPSGEEQLVQPSNSIIHGLTGFFVLCYSQSTHTSLHLLASAILHGKGSKEDGQSLVFYDGKLEYFKTGHLPYAIPATLVLLSITALLPLLLLSYPLCYRVLALCRIQESKFTRILCRVIPLERYKPLFDSFQGSFKDDHRYFAGLYFMYRLVWLVTLAYTRELASYYVLLEVELVVMLALNAYVQPYKKTWHNRVDTCIFALLAIINGCTIYNYHKRDDYTHPTDYIQVISTFQIVLACLPLLCVAGYLAWQGAKLAGKKLREKATRGSSVPDDVGEEGDLMEMLASGSREEQPSSSVGYKKFTSSAS